MAHAAQPAPVGRFPLGVAIVAVVCVVIGAIAVDRARYVGAASTVDVRVALVRPRTAPRPSTQMVAATASVLRVRIAGDADWVGLLDAIPADVRVVRRGRVPLIDVKLTDIDQRELTETLTMLTSRGATTLVALGDRPVSRGAIAAHYPILAYASDVDRRAVVAGVDNHGAPAVDIRIGGAAMDRVDRYTGRHSGGYLGLAIDGRIVESQRILQAVPDGNLQLTDYGTTQACRNLAALIRFGPLPAALTLSGRPNDIF